MTDTSDGESKPRQFVNLTNTHSNQLAKKIAETYAFSKLCYNIANGKPVSDCVNELKTYANNEAFKLHLAIPRKSIIEPNLNETTVSFLFKHRSNTHSVKIKLNEEIVKSYSVDFIENHLKAKNDKQIPIDVDNPITKNVSTEMTMEQKIDKLIQQVDNLTKLLTVEQEKNKKLTEQLQKYEEEKCANESRKRKNPGLNSAKKKKCETQNKTNDTARMCIDNDTMESSDSDTNTPTTHTRIDNVASKTTNTNTTAQPRAPTDSEQNRNNGQHSTPVSKPIAKRERKVPPIVVFDDNQKRMNERITSRQICTKTEYHFIRVNKSKYRIQVNTLEQYDSLLKMLTEIGIKYHTYTPPERKPIHVLLKRIPTCYDETDILQYLNDDHGLSPLRLTKFTTKRMVENGVESSIWHASFDPKTDKKKIFAIKHIGNVYGIVIEQLINKSLTQCRRCWRFEHTESNCTYDGRCHSCLASHEIGKCILDTNASLKPSCVNCKNESHSANSKECPVYQRILERKNSPGNKPTKNAKQTSITTTFSQPNKTNTTFASTVSGNQHQGKPKAQTNSNNDILNILKHLATQQVQMTELIMKIAPQLAFSKKNEHH